MKKPIQLLATGSRCGNCNTVTLTVKGFVDQKDGAFLPEIDGDIDFKLESGSVADQIFKDFKGKQDYYITISPTKHSI